MSYKIDGSSHKNGLENEELQRNVLLGKTIPNFGVIISAQKQGGTKNKNDSVLINSVGQCYGLSSKRHETGTFDWANLSDVFLLKNNESIISLVQTKENYRQMVSADPSKFEELKKDLKIQTEIVVQSFLSKLGNDQIIQILNNSFKFEQLIGITKTKNNELIVFPASDMRIHNLISEQRVTFFTKAKRKAKTSISIYARFSNGEEFDTNLRLRVVWNNGCGSALGKVKSDGKSGSACLCIKVQQDNINKLLQEVNPLVIRL